MTEFTRRGLILTAAAAAPALILPMMATPALAKNVMPDIARIQIRKAKRKIDLIGTNGKLLKSYDTWLGSNPVGHKQFQRDGRTPEGAYRIDRRNQHSAFFLSLGVSYPNRRDRAMATSKGKSPGGDIFIHGQPNGRRGIAKYDWTRGCAAVSNEDMKELWRLIPLGCQINIYA